ncbi:Co2+/Mg2+ efflux protein ApaG [Ectothiorhodospiraceae bacterium BW-2]|nr:Co2+/Mg2+ efflux protein ApaG [Ectothiorhodospiraceae bacterium BW-2]
MSPQQHPINHIDIKVSTHYLAEQSDPANMQYVFSYTITLTNRGTIAAQLLSRHWRITDGNNQLQEVFGEGVVGEQPYLQPKESYQYTSGAILETPYGTMEGSYQMINDLQQRFDAPIAMFALSCPNLLH